jgi:hypothetical protein
MAILHARAHVLDAALSFGIARLMGREHGLTHTSYSGASSWTHNMLSNCAHAFDIILALRVVHDIETIICYAYCIFFAYLHLCRRDVPVLLIFPPRRVVPGTTQFSFLSFFILSFLGYAPCRLYIRLTSFNFKLIYPKKK